MAAYSFISLNGTIVPDTSSIQSEVEQEWIDALGLSEAPDPSSAEGRLIDAEVTSRISVARNNALLANQQNPNLASGTFLDAHLALLGSERDSAERSTVQCVLTGVPGTLIPAGRFAEGDDRALWQSAFDATLDSSGQATATFRSVEFGPVTADPDSITKIISGVVGWETINNPAPASPGKLEQSDRSARRQRRLELGANSRSNSYSVISAVSKVLGVNGIKFLENTAGTEQLISNVTMQSHSTWVCVDGGVDTDIAEAYYRARTGGSGFNGDITINYTDPASGQVIPVQFDRPDDVPLICRITAKIGNASIDDVREAAAQYAAGDTESELGFYLGEDASPFEVAAGVNSLLPSVFVTRCELAKKSAGAGAYSTNTIDILIFEKASLLAADVEVVVV